MKRKSITIRDVAQRAEVSIGTVSRVLNNVDDVSSDIRARVQLAIDALGYRPSMVAQAMRKASSKLIGCIIRDITIAPLAIFYKTAQKEFEARNYTLIVADSDADKSRELELLRVFASRRLDGMIMQSSFEEDLDVEAAIRATQVPFILVDRLRPLGADTIVVNHKLGVVQATEYLMRLGHERIALVTARPTVHASRARIEGFVEIHQQKNVPLDPWLLRTGTFRAESAFQETSILLADPERPTAIIAGGLDLLAGVLRAVKVRGLKIPEDLSVIACGDSLLAELCTPPITVIRWDLAEIGRLASTMLLDRLTGTYTDPKPRHVMLPIEFVLRESCAAPRKGHDVTGLSR